MAYDYVKRVYGVNPVVGARVRHTEMKGPRSYGTIAREKPSQGHHVMVRFDGQNFSSPCHPTALDYAPSSQEEGAKKASRSQPSGVAPSELTDPQSQHSDGEG